MSLVLAICLLQTVGVPPGRDVMSLQGETVVARFVVTVPVDPPTMLAAIAHPQLLWIFGRTVTLSWKASPDNSAPNWKGYVAYRATGSTFTALNSTPSKALTLKDSSVKKGQTYRYYAVAVIGKVMSKPSNIVSVTP